MLSSYRIHLYNTNKRSKKFSNTTFDNNSHRDIAVKRPRLTSNDLKPTSKEFSPHIKSVKCKNTLKGGANIENNEKYLDEIVHNDFF